MTDSTARDIPNTPLDRELTEAVQRRQVQAEHRINLIRGGLLLFFAAADFTLAAIWGNTDLLLALYIIPVIVAPTYWFIIHWLSRPGQPYRPPLKYITITTDFTMTLIVCVEMFGVDFFPPEMTGDVLVLIDICFIGIINSANFMRISTAAIVYSTTLAVGASSYLILTYASTPTFLFVPLITLAPVGFIASDLSQGLLKLFIRLARRERLTRFLSREVVEEIDAGRIQLELGGEEAVVTVLLSDIRDFTKMAEDKPPQEIIATLNEFYTVMTRIIFENGGMVDKFIGDAILAVFGVPEAKPDDAVRAVRCSFEMQQALGRINETRKSRDLAPLRMGVALHTGVVVAGIVGSPQRMEYTVIGDTANLTARIEGYNRELGTDILLSGETAALLDTSISTTPIREISVRGRKKPVRLYTVTGYVPDAEGPFPFKGGTGREPSTS